MDPARKLATYDDLRALPADVKGEVIDGVLITALGGRGGEGDRESLLAGGKTQAQRDVAFAGAGIAAASSAISPQ